MHIGCRPEPHPSCGHLPVCEWSDAGHPGRLVVRGGGGEAGHILEVKAYKFVSFTFVFAALIVGWQADFKPLWCDIPTSS